jgi:hypothetical protein
MMTAYKALGFDIKDYPNAYHLFFKFLGLGACSDPTTQYGLRGQFRLRLRHIGRREGDISQFHIHIIDEIRSK